MRVSRLIIPFVILLCASFCSCAKKAEKTETVEVPPVPVVVQKPQVGSVTRWYKTTAELASPLETVVGFLQGGKIIELAVDEGDRVSAGQYLGKVDTSVYQSQYAAAQSSIQAAENQAEAARSAAEAAQAQLETARTAFEQAERDYNRFLKLREEGVVTQAEFEKVKLGYDTARLSLEAARSAADAAQAQAKAAEASVQAAKDAASQVAKLIDYGTLKAPFSGRIAEKTAEPGMVVGPGTPVYRIVADNAALNRLEARYSIPENLVGQVTMGMQVYLKLISLEEEIPLNVDVIGPEIRSSDRTAQVISYVSTDTLPILPGMFGTVRIPVETHHDAMLLPEAAVIDLQTEKIVYVADGDVARRRTVKTGLIEEGLVEILEGISLGDEIIVEGNRYLKDGAKIVRQQSSLKAEEEKD